MSNLQMNFSDFLLYIILLLFGIKVGLRFYRIRNAVMDLKHGVRITH